MIAFWPVALQQLLAVELSVGGLVGSVVANIIVLILTWVIASRVSTAVLQKQNDNLAGAISSLTSTIKSVQDTISEVQRSVSDEATAREHCEKRSMRSYATRDQYAQVLAEQATDRRDVMAEIARLAESFRESVGKVHGRVDELVKVTTAVATELRVRGETKKGEPHV